MILTAQDIQSQQFHVRFRGFDVDEVDDFLEKIATAFQAVSEENQSLKDRLEGMEKELATYQNQQKSFQKAILAAQNVADGMKEKSREEAEAIVAEARQEAILRREEANLEIAGLKKKIDHLKTLREQAREDLRQQLNSYLHMLETEPVDNTRAAEHFSSPARQQETKRGSIHAPAAEPETGPPQENIPTAAEEADLADLYVKIVIPDSGLQSISPEAPYSFAPHDIALPSALAASKDMLIMDEDEDSSPVLPDLDGDMAFNLDDPLEEHEPAVSFAESLADAKMKKTARFNPDESPL